VPHRLNQRGLVHSQAIVKDRDVWIAESTVLKYDIYVLGFGSDTVVDQIRE